MIDEKVLIERLKSEVNYNDGAEIGSKQAIDIVKDLTSEHNNGWIPCSERLPKDHCESVLATTKDGLYYIASYDSVYKEYLDMTFLMMAVLMQTCRLVVCVLICVMQ